MSKPKHIAKQVEVKWDKPEPFALVVQTTLDGDRIAREKAQKEQDKAHADTLQLDWEDAAKQFSP